MAGLNADPDRQVKEKYRILDNHKEWIWHVLHRPQQLFYMEFIYRMFRDLDRATSVDSLLDNLFIIVEDSDLTRKEKKLLANLLKP